jgi:hypothetical protein
MSKEEFVVGDWVQAVEVITEPNFMGELLWQHAHKGAVGHVMGLDGEWLTVTFEHSGTTTDCHFSEVKWLFSPISKEIGNLKALVS